MKNGPVGESVRIERRDDLVVEGRGNKSLSLQFVTSKRSDLMTTRAGSRMLVVGRRVVELASRHRGRLDFHGSR